MTKRCATDDIAAARTAEDAISAPERRLPDVIGIGVPKAGTTWLYQVLASHPRVWMPERREMHFFDREYERGVDWYARFFPLAAQATQYSVVGEITPHYLYGGRDTASLIRNIGTVRQLILLLRDPIDRAYSHYWFRVRVERYAGTFEQFLGERPEAIEWGQYARYLEQFYEVFPSESVLVYLYEEVFPEPRVALADLAQRLKLDPAGFSSGATRETTNARFVPRWPRLYATTLAAARLLRRLHLDTVVNRLRQSGLRRLTEAPRTTAPVPMEPTTRSRLAELFAPEVAHLETLLARDLEVWRQRW